MARSDGEGGGVRELSSLWVHAPSSPLGPAAAMSKLRTMRRQRAEGGYTRKREGSLFGGGGPRVGGRGKKGFQSEGRRRKASPSLPHLFPPRVFYGLFLRSFPFPSLAVSLYNSSKIFLDRRGLGYCDVGSDY